MKKLVLCLFMGFFVLAMPAKTHAVPAYCAEVQDLSAAKQKVAKGILNKILAEKQRPGYYKVPNVATCTFDELVKYIRILDRTYFPYQGTIKVQTFYASGSGNGNRYTWSLYCKPATIYNNYVANSACKAKAKSWTNHCVNSKMSKKEKAVAIGKYVAAKTSYKVSCAEPRSILNNGQGNCQAMAYLYKEMCKMAGISTCRFAHGYVNGGAHGWNTMVINGTRYYTDTCFYDGTKNSAYLVKTSLPAKYIAEND